jgi:hypothetical protein
VVSIAVVWFLIGGAVVVILVLIALQLGRTPDRDRPGSRADAPSADAGPQASGTLDPDDERVSFADRRRFPALKWDPVPAADDPDDAVDEDDRSPADRPSHPANRWEHD